MTSGTRRGPGVCPVGRCWAKPGELCIFPLRWACARRQPGQVPAGHPDAAQPVPWGEHPRDCDCGDCP